MAASVLRFLAHHAMSRAMMRLIINGEAQIHQDDLTILGLVEALQLNPRKVAVERNLEVVPKSLHAETRLADGDRIEIVQFVGGG
ncbi:MAG: thiamine biosynthesis protein ThiS [Hyphobacterium sp.]|nr:MAG: thiamine biosynthesis protein ThiS [Hyphobacterium sp.]